ncbi:hypothetical protein EFR01_04690 [Sinorhizobium fredii]|nr:hypothetical protein EFR01_04690 [Sinorhizobium fredii]
MHQARSASGIMRGRAHASQIMANDAAMANRTAASGKGSISLRVKVIAGKAAAQTKIVVATERMGIRGEADLFIATE